MQFLYRSHFHSRVPSTLSRLYFALPSAPLTPFIPSSYIPYFAIVIPAYFPLTLFFYTWHYVFKNLELYWHSTLTARDPIPKPSTKNTLHRYPFLPPFLLHRTSLSLSFSLAFSLSRSVYHLLPIRALGILSCTHMFCFRRK